MDIVHDDASITIMRSTAHAELYRTKPMMMMMIMMSAAVIPVQSQTMRDI